MKEKFHFRGASLHIINVPRRGSSATASSCSARPQQKVNPASPNRRRAASAASRRTLLDYRVWVNKNMESQHKSGVEKTYQGPLFKTSVKQSHLGTDFVREEFELDTSFN